MNNLSKAVQAVVKQANHNATRCIMVWAALALREEGYGAERLKRVLDNIQKYSRMTLNGKIDIDDQIKHLEKVTGLRFVFSKEGEITVEEMEEAERYDTEAV